MGILRITIDVGEVDHPDFDFTSREADEMVDMCITALRKANYVIRDTKTVKLKEE